MKIFIQIIVAFCFYFGWSQDQTNLLQKIKNSKSEDQAAIYNELAEKENNVLLMFDYAKKGLEKAIENSQQLEQAKAHFYIGIYHLNKSDYANAQMAFENVKILIKDDYSNNKELEILFSKSTANLGLVLMEQNHYFKALTNYQLAKSIFEKQNQSSLVSQIDNNIGVIYRSVGDYQNALKYFKNVIDFQKSAPSASLGYAYANIGRTYQAQNSHKKAHTNYQKALQTFEKYPDARGSGELHNYMAETALSLKDYEAVAQHLAAAEQQFNTIEYAFGLSDTYLIFGKFCLEQNQTDKALAYAQKTLSIGDKLNAIETQANALQLLSKIYESNNQLALAFDHLKQYNQLKAELTDIKTIRVNFETEKQHALDQQKAAHELTNEKDFRNILFWIFGFILVVGALLSYFIVQNHKKAKQAAELQKEMADYEQKALHLQMNPHFVFNCLAAISSFIVQNSQHEAIRYLSKFSKLMRLTLDYSKVSLISVDKEIEGLTNYLELEKLRFQNIFDFIITKDPTIEDDCALPPMLLQPLVENAIIHGIVPQKDKNNGKIEIIFTQKNDYLLISIIDNGIGFNVSKENKANSLASHESMALDIVSKRLNKMHNNQASFELKDVSNDEKSGTEVTLRLPLQYLEIK